MARKDDIETAGAAPVLKGLAQEMAAMVRRHADAVFAKAAQAQGEDAADFGAINQTMRIVTAIARAASAVHALQAAEDKAAERASDARAARAAAIERARPPIFDEGDETDMNERDPRLDTPEGVAEIREEARRSLESFLQRLETKRAERRRDRGPDDRGSPGAEAKLAVEGAPAPAPA